MVYYFVRLCLVMIYFPFRKLIAAGFPKDKIIIHSDVDLLESLTLKRLHCREMDTLAFDYKAQHPDVEVSMSTHTINSVKQAYQHQLDYVFYGHIFTTALSQISNLDQCLKSKPCYKFRFQSMP